MRIGLVSDTHIKITKPDTLDGFFRMVSRQKFDVLCHAGDYTGGLMGWECVRDTVRIMRKYMPDSEIITVLGNHDYWCFDEVTKSVNMQTFNKNLSLIKSIFTRNNIHFLDHKGIIAYGNEGVDRVFFTGVSGWYAHPSPPTNDHRFLPKGVAELNMNRTLLSRAEKLLMDQMDQLDKQNLTPSDIVVFMSHFPVVNAGRDYKGAFEDFSWSERIKDIMQERYNCKFFLNGHAHAHHRGPLRYECGSDYYNPKFITIDV